jgi:excinuclease ABC subunit A
MTDRIVVRGAREHNLKNVSVELPKGALVVVTGPSGSGKSSLAIDTIYAEGRRRYLESLSTYARQMLGPLPRPDVDWIDGLSPAICVDQRGAVRNPRSTVGTITDLAELLRLIFAHAGTPSCPLCGSAVEAHTISEILESILSLPEGSRAAVTAPVVRGGSGVHEALERARKDGFVRAAVNGRVLDLGEIENVEVLSANDVDVHVDRLVVRTDVRQRARDAIELATRLADGFVRVSREDGSSELFSERSRCVACETPFPELTPRLFSFNAPEGACSGCDGIGTRMRYDEAKVEAFFRTLEGKKKSSSSNVVARIEARIAEASQRAEDGEPGAEDALEQLLGELAPFRTESVCDVCRGARLSREALAVRLATLSIDDFSRQSVDALLATFDSLTLSAFERDVTARAIGEARSRLRVLKDVGLGYLTLDRASMTLSGGEIQRVRLATEIGSQLSGVLYVLDEPSVGLHPRDTDRLIESLKALRDRGNTVIVVEHDLDVLRAADWVVDMGPRAGVEGGRVVASGSLEAIVANVDSSTGAALGRAAVGRGKRRRSPTRSFGLKDASLHNLAHVDVEIPYRALTVVTGVSGSGKSSLVIDTLLPKARARLRTRSPQPNDGLVDFDGFERVIAIDQTPLGRTRRANPATYVGIYDTVRELYAGLPESRARGYKPSRFSFNVKGGRCETCAGEGVRRVEMSFLPDVVVPCSACGGKRFHRETLDIRYRGLDIAELLSTSVVVARDLFAAVPKIYEPLAALVRVGLGYLELGQSATTLSGGEAQRVKLARELARTRERPTLYVLDEPTTGLARGDIETLLTLLDELVEGGHTVLVVEHDLDVMAFADHIIDLGPDGGPDGGRVVATGTPEQVAAAPTHTGRHLARWLSS